MLKILKSFLEKNEDSHPVTEKKLVVLGSSSSEVFDYIFGDNPNYYPYWAGAWNARDLNQPMSHNYITNILVDIPRNANIFLCFGAIDIDFVLSVKYQHGFNDLKTFVHEIYQALVDFVSFLKSLDFLNIYITLPFLPVNISDAFWKEVYQISPAPIDMKSKAIELLNDKLLNDKSIHFITLADRLKNVSSNRYELDNRFMRNRPDNHANYLKIQDYVWDAIKNIDGILPRRAPRHNQLYSFESILIGDLMHANNVRKRTCR